MVRWRLGKNYNYRKIGKMAFMPNPKLNEDLEL